MALGVVVLLLGKNPQVGNKLGQSASIWTMMFFPKGVLVQGPMLFPKSSAWKRVMTTFVSWRLAIWPVTTASTLLVATAGVT